MWVLPIENYGMYNTHTQRLRIIFEWHNNNDLMNNQCKVRLCRSYHIDE